MGSQAAQIAIREIEGVFKHAIMNREGPSLKNSRGAIPNLFENVLLYQKTIGDAQEKSVFPSRCCTYRAYFNSGATQGF